LLKNTTAKSCAGRGVGEAVGEGVAVGARVAVGVGVLTTWGEEVAVAVADADAVGVGGADSTPAAPIAR
jgi:hypothetical protein